jgi:hypothetical protein
MKNPTDAAFEQDYNAQVAVDQGSLLIVGWALSNHPNDSKARRTHPRYHSFGHWHAAGGSTRCRVCWPCDLDSV